ncbi:MAG: cytochrome c3 family protein [Deltaproteobacteria bacterium]|nr:cytochrome c3 family protein [Deltaproteobacteria bacterium]
MSLARLVVACAALLVGCSEAPPPEQPIPFNHEIHGKKAKLTCLDCHSGATERARAGFPSTQSCLFCHVKPQGDKPTKNERLVRDVVAREGQIRWVQVNRNPGHVHFSHAMHVVAGKLACVQCHGDVSKWKEPPKSPSPELSTMEACMDCHRLEGASNNCRVCHK